MLGKPSLQCNISYRPSCAAGDDVPKGRDARTLASHALDCLSADDLLHILCYVTCHIIFYVAGDDVPKGRDAVGWRVAVYWKDDRTFYEGELADYELSTGRHKVGNMVNKCVRFCFNTLFWHTMSHCMVLMSSCRVLEG
jgi:hypothetical protein